MNTKYVILIAAILAVIHYLVAGSAPTAAPANVAPQARPARIAPSSIAPAAPISPAAAPAPTAPVGSSPIAPIAAVAPIPPQSVNSNYPVYPYAYTYGSNNAYFTNGIPTAYLRNTNSVAWATNPPYGNPSAGYTNNGNRLVLPYPVWPSGNTSAPSIKQ